MDYSIAFILPNITTCENVKKVLQDLGYQYPVYAKSTKDALETANELLAKGLHLVISQGLTLEYLSSQLSIPTLELPFSGLDTLLVVRGALRYRDKKIVHVGTKHLYHYIQRSLEVLDLPTDCIAFQELTFHAPQEQIVQSLINEGYEVFIGGFIVTDYARSHGKIAFEFNVDDLSVEATLANAQAIVQSIMNLEERNELDRAILQSTPNGMIVVDSKRCITQLNSFALDIIKDSAEALVGKSIDEVLKQHHIVDVETDDKIDQVNYTKVLLQETPVVIHEVQKGTVISMSRVSDIQNLEYRTKSDLLQKGLFAKYTFDDIQGISPEILDVKSQAYSYAKYDSPILLYGETGTGKELFAQSIHNASSRRKQPFVAINCASLPENLIESELFGYVQGAFTGAKKNGKKGLFEIADHGTIFLDEISEISIAIQSKLLRVIQEGEIMRIGGDKVIHVDTRVICSSNKDLLELICENRFKNDLYYRIAILELNIPPLRERSGDVEYLANIFMRSCAIKHKKRIDSIDPKVVSILSNMYLGGNVRELRSIIERMVILAEGSVLDEAVLKKCRLRSLLQENINRSNVNIKDVELRAIEEALEKCGGNKTAAARMLGIDPSTLYRKIKKYGL